MILQIRAAQEADHTAVLNFTATTWEHGDYIERVWEEWLHDSAGELLVGTLADEPVALLRVSMLAAGVAWLEGLRVAAPQRRAGIGQAMMQHGIALAQHAGAHTVRLFTDSENTRMQRLATRQGMRPVLDVTHYQAHALEGTPQLTPLTTAHLAALERMLAAAPLLLQSGGFSIQQWRCERLTTTRLHHHLQQGEVVAAHDEDMALPQAWLILLTGKRMREVSYMCGQGAPLVRLLREARRGTPHPKAPAMVRTLLPTRPVVAPELAAAGFSNAEIYLHMQCYERRLAGRSKKQAPGGVHTEHLNGG